MNHSLSEIIKQELNKCSKKIINKDVENLEDALKLCYRKGFWISVDCLYLQVGERTKRVFFASVYHKETSKISMDFHITPDAAYNDAFEYVLKHAKCW